MRLKDAAAGTAKLPPGQKATPRRCGREAKQERGVMVKSVYAVAAAAIVAGAFVATLSVSGRSRPAVRCRISRADRADIRPLARDCSQNAWPYFEAACASGTRAIRSSRRVRRASFHRIGESRALKLQLPRRESRLMRMPSRISISTEMIFCPPASSASVTFTVTSAS
jgi:hypothetical protein